MIGVIDTSAAVDIVLQTDQGKRLASFVEDAHWIIAPALFICEVTNVFWKYHRFEGVPSKTCETHIDHAIAIPDEFILENDLYKEAFVLACQSAMPVYDMFFLVLARRHNALLLTVDKRLKQEAARYAIRTQEYPSERNRSRG